MKTLYLAWQDTGTSRKWFPIGKLEADIHKSFFQFGYTEGARRAHQEAGFQPLPNFPDFNKLYESDELFPLFTNRVMGKNRDDFQEYLVQLDLKPEQADPISILSVSGGTRRTDQLEIFPGFKINSDGRFSTRFFLKGWRHLDEKSKKRIEKCKEGDMIQTAVELNNPVTGLAIQLQTRGDYCMIGWAPRYLLTELLKCIQYNPLHIESKVIRVNHAPAPIQERVLIEMSGAWPEGLEPMSHTDYKELWSVKELADI